MNATRSVSIFFTNISSQSWHIHCEVPHFSEFMITQIEICPMRSLLFSYFPVAVKLFSIKLQCWVYCKITASFYVFILIFCREVSKIFSTNLSAVSFLSFILCLIGFLLVFLDIFRIMSRTFFCFCVQVYSFYMLYPCISFEFFNNLWYFSCFYICSNFLGLLLNFLCIHGLLDFVEADHFVEHFLRLQRRVLIKYIMCSLLFIFASKFSLNWL